MYLKALEIQGFKSFAEKTRLTFEKDITAIVGPNGSGKSNISDAILWVMGEQRTKSLRGTKMEDVIFGGTEKRGAMGFAQVSLIIDNSAHIFDYDVSEIMLTRRYYRSGESEYYINKEAVRLKDINSLLMDTGLGRDGYSIIGQGRIAEIVSTRSTDRREVFEEAAGISRYRYRKEEAERKLEKTEDNLLRINDKIEELEMQVGPLKTQSETAKRFLLLRDKLRVKEVSAWMATLDKLHSQSDSVNLEYQQAKDNLDKAREELDELYATSENLSERMHQKDVESEQARERLSGAVSAVADCESQRAVINADIRSSRENMQRMLNDIAEQDSRSAELRGQIESAKERIGELDKELEALSRQSVENNNILDGCRMKLKSREDALQSASDKATKLAVDCRSMDSRINMLTEMEKDYEGYSRAVKTVMREAERGTLKGVFGPVANLIKTDSEFALAVETALGAAAQNIVIESQNDGRIAIELLKRTDSGRATFLPVDTIRGRLMDNAPKNAAGYVGIASELVSFDSKYQQIILNLLGRTVVAESMSDAIRMSKAANASLRIVTLDGQLINAGGSMTGGSAAKGSGILSRANQLEALKAERIKAGQEEKTCADALEKARSAISAVRYQLDMALEDQSELRSKTSSFSAEKSATANSVTQLELLLNSLSGDTATRTKAVAAAQSSIDALEARLVSSAQKLKELNEKVDAINNEISEIYGGKLTLEGKRNKNDKAVKELGASIVEMERQTGRIEQKKLAADMEEKQILNKLWDNYELSHSAAQTLRENVESIPKANKEINELRSAINALGTPNLGAIEEYERVSTRYEFLAGQRDDIEKAKSELMGIIRNVTSEMKEIFITRFKEIDNCFRQTFLELFGGGKAALELEDESNVLECGINIKVQPPGKALSSISLLSGGEMAFVAIALYFAILKVRPTPFCVMDEIEAALDEANVSRFAEYMRRISDKTQFLIITHRRGTMESADVLYGVTMQEKGVSTVISLDLATARKTAED